MNLIKRTLLVPLVLFCGLLFAYEYEKEDYLSNSYYAPLVAKIESELLVVDGVKGVNVYKAADPFPFMPDLFYIELEMANGHRYVFECILANLRFCNTFSNIRLIDGQHFRTITSTFGIINSDVGIVLSKISGIRKLKIKTLPDFLKNEDVLYAFFTKPEKDILHETKSNVIFRKVDY